MNKDLNSRMVTKGTECAPHRSLLYAMGWDKTNLEKPLIGVAVLKESLVPGGSIVKKAAVGLGMREMLSPTASIAGRYEISKSRGE